MEENPKRFIDEVCKILGAMGVSSEEKDEISTYQLKYVAKIWYEQWKSERLVEAGPIDCEVFKEEFLDMFFPIELRE